MNIAGLLQSCNTVSMADDGKVAVQARVRPESVDRIDAEAKRLGISRSETVRWMLAFAMEQDGQWRRWAATKTVPVK